MEHQPLRVTVEDLARSVGDANEMVRMQRSILGFDADWVTDSGGIVGETD
jgi:hypothetical protein